MICGLKFSLGKNYTSRDYCVINSELYAYNRQPSRRHSPDTLFKKVPAINSRLFEGGSRSSVGGRFPFHPADVRYLASLPDIKEKLPRLTNQVGRSVIKALNREVQHRGRSFTIWDKYCRWFNTIEQRWDVLQGQAQINKYQTYITSDAFKTYFSKRFCEVQFERLSEFRVGLGRQLLDTASYSIPQQLGGFGLPPPSDYNPTHLDIIKASIAYSHPKEALKAAQKWRPKSATAPFMTLLLEEISFLSDCLHCKVDYTIPEYKSFQIGEQDETTWSLPLIAGFVSPTNVVVTELEQELVYDREFKLRKLAAIPMNRVAGRAYQRLFREIMLKENIQEFYTRQAEGRDGNERALLSWVRKHPIETRRQRPRF